MASFRDRQISRALNQRVAQATVTAASNAVVISEQVAAVAGTVPADLAGQLDGLRERIREVEEQLP